MHALVSTARPFVYKLWKLSEDERQRFPLMCTSIQMTVMVINAIRGRQLSSTANKTQDLMGAAHALHAALLWRFYAQWVGGSCTIHDYDRVRKELLSGVMSSTTVTKWIAEFDAAQTRASRVADAGGKPSAPAFADVEEETRPKREAAGGKSVSAQNGAASRSKAYGV